MTDRGMKKSQNNSAGCFWVLPCGWVQGSEVGVMKIGLTRQVGMCHCGDGRVSLQPAGGLPHSTRSLNVWTK